MVALDHTVLSDRLPDFSHPGTVGCLLAIVREAYGDPGLYVRRSTGKRKEDGLLGWEAFGTHPQYGTFHGWGWASEAETLVALLEDAPESKAGLYNRETETTEADNDD